MFAPLPEPEENTDIEVEAYRSYVYETEGMYAHLAAQPVCSSYTVEGDTYLWDDVVDSPDNSLVNGNVIVAGTLNKLVLWLTNSDKHGMHSP